MQILDATITHSMIMRSHALQPKRMDSMDDAQKAGMEFESYFVGFMLNAMFEDMNTDGLMGGGMSEQMFRSLLLEEYGKNIAQSNTLGISKNIVQAIENRKRAMESIQDQGVHHDRVI